MEGKKKFYKSTPKAKQNNGEKKQGFEKKDNKDFKKKDSKSFDKKPSKKFDNKGSRKFEDKKNDKKFDRKNDRFEKKSYDKPKVEEANVASEKKSNVRLYIYQCLCNIYQNKAFSNIDIDHMIRENDLNDLDKKLLTNVVYGTLQHDKLLYWEITKLSEKAPNFNNKVILLMSLYQLRYLDKMPAFAIINEAVEIAKNVEGEYASKYVNAILREATRRTITPSLDDFKNKKGNNDENEYLSIMYNIPAFIIKMWFTHYGREVTLKTLEVSNKEAPLTCRVNTSYANVDEILANYPDFVKGQLGKNSLIYNGTTPIMENELFKSKKISIQDESSQYVVEVLDPKENDKVLDMCAAPGSKTTYIATTMKNTGKVLAIDVHEHRVELMKKYLTNLGITNTTCVTFDSTKLSSKEKLVGTFDKVLLDAPCSGLGVCRRKPDILLDFTDKKLDELISLQEKLLNEAYYMVKKGGVLVYSTCTINKKENDLQVMKFLSDHKDMKRVEERQIFPYEYDSDGFYICKLVKDN